jgi:putative flippase GtrA
VNDQNVAGSAPEAAIAQDPLHAKGFLRRLAQRLSGGQFLRYLCVGVFNTIFGYITFAATLFLLTHITPQRFLYLTVMAAAILSTPFNIVVAYFGYKLFVFKTRGNYLKELLKCFGVYGVGMLPGLLALGAVTRLLQSLIHTHSAGLHAEIAAIAVHLSGQSLKLLQNFSSGKAIAGYLAGALVQGFTVIFSFIGHKKVTFRTKSS